MMKVDNKRSITKNATVQKATPIQGLIKSEADLRLFLKQHPATIAHINSWFSDPSKARASAARINAVFSDSNARIEDYLAVLDKETPITLAVMLELFSLQDAVVRQRLDELKLAVQSKVSETNRENASKRGRVWRQAAVERFLERRDEYGDTFARAARDMVGTMLRTVDGRAEAAPESTVTIERWLGKARKQGLI